jgi:hypothetical protein
MNSVSRSPFPRDVVPELIAARDDVARYLATYFSSDPAVGYAGRFFEQMIERSDPDQFTPWDMVVVSTLSVEIPPRVATEILLPGPTREQAIELLAAMQDPGVSLETADDADIAEGAPAEQLYRLLRGLAGMGATKTSKLLAAKRPELVPIRDSVVERLLQAGATWWSPMRQLARDDRLHALIADASSGVVPDNVSYLRRLDVVLWCYGTEHGSLIAADSLT